MYRCLTTVVCTLLMLLAGGCENDTTHTFGEGFRKSLNKPTPAQYMAMTGSDNPDERREGLLGLAQNPRAFDSKVLKLYAVVAAAKNEEVPVRAVALDVLGRAGDPTYLAVVVGCLEDESPRVRWEAANALDGVHGDLAVEPLRRHVVTDESAQVRTACAVALRHYRRPDVCMTLARVLNDGDFTVRYRAHSSLVQLAGKDLGRETDPWLEFAQQLPQPAASSPASGPRR